MDVLLYIKFHNMMLYMNGKNTGRREIWNESEYIIKIPEVQRKSLAVLNMKKATGEFVFWEPNEEDLLAKDWSVMNDKSLAD